MSQTLYLQALRQHQQGQLHHAETLYQQVLTLHPQHADALHYLGVIYLQTERIPQAIRTIAQALQLQANADYYNHYGLALKANKQWEEAVSAFEQGLKQNPKDQDLQLNLGNLHLEMAQFTPAAHYYRSLAQASPKDPHIKAALVHCLLNIGNQAHQSGDYTHAEICFKEAVQLAPQDASLHYNLGNAQRELGRPKEAMKQFQRALQYAPNDADTHNNLGNVQRELGQLDAAIASYQKAFALNPKLYHAKVHALHQKQHICDWSNLTADIDEIRTWIRTQTDAQISPFAFLSMPGTTAEEQKICADHWVAQRYAERMTQKPLFQPSVPMAKRKINIGYLSADFRLHPLAFLISELLELHDRNHFEISGFSYCPHEESTARARFQKAFDHFYDIRTLTESDAANKIHACGIDILVDLTGFTQSSRSGIVALRPAPIQVNWLGFPGTMGALPAQKLFDCLLTDAFITPPDAALYYAETLTYLPHSYQPNDRQRPVGQTPPRASCGLEENAFVFCCFNQSFKITPDVFTIWMRLLNHIPNSVLWLLDCNPWAKKNLQQEAHKYGISANRLIFAPRIDIAGHLARQTHADLFLDTLPYNAHTTCSDALWMGLPVLTCVGDTFPARVSGSLLLSANLPELITHSLQDYEDKALYLARNPAVLNGIKQKLAENKAHCPLFDTPRFTQDLEAAYQSMWNDYLQHKT